MSDEQYDILKEELQSREPEHKLLKIGMISFKR